MTAASWLTLIGMLGFPTIVVALFKLFENRTTVRAAAPRVDAEAQDIVIGSQKKVIETLIVENDRLVAKLDREQTLAEEREKRHAERVTHLSDALDEALGDLHRQLKAMRTATDFELEQLRAEAVIFRQRVEILLRTHDIEAPAWWPR